MKLQTKISSKSLPTAFFTLIAGIVCLGSTQNTWAQTTYTWLPTTGTGEWNTGTNWSTNPQVPFDFNSIANFQIDLTNNAITTLSTDRSARKIMIGDTTSTFFTHTIDSNNVNLRTITLGTATGTEAIGISSQNAINTFTANVALVLAANKTFEHTTFAGRLQINSTVNNGGFLLTAGGTGQTNLSGVVSGSGGLTQIDGTLFLLAANTYSGLTSIDGGTLAYGVNNAIASGAVSVNGGSLQINSFSDTVGTVTLTSGSIDGSTGVLTGTSYDVRSGSISAILGGAGVALTKTTGGTVTLSGVNTYTGLTSVNAGTLAYGVNNAIASGNVTVGGGTLSMLTFSDTVGAVTLTSGSITGSTGVLTGTSYAVESGSISAILGGGASALTKTTNGTVVLSGANSYGGGTTVSGGVLQGTTTSLQGNIANDASVVFNQTFNGTYAGNMNGTGSMTKSGSGTVILGGTIMNYSGGTTVSGGTLQGTTQSMPGNIVNNASVVFNQTTNGSYSGDMSGTGSLTKSNTGTVALGGLNSYSGGTTVSGGILEGTTTSLQGSITNNATVTFDQGGFDGTYAGSISGTGNLIKVNTSAVTFAGTNTYTGNTTVNGGSLIVSGSISSGASSAVTVNSGGTAQINGALTAGSVTVNSGGTLQGTGSITTLGGGNVIVAGILDPGNSIDTLTIAGDLVLSGTYDWEVVLGGALADITVVNGNIDLTGSLINILSSGTFVEGEKFTAIAYSGTLTGTFGALPPFGIPSYAFWRVNYNDSSFGLNGNGGGGPKFITLTAVPEPGSIGIIGIAGLCSFLICTNRRRRLA